MKKNRLVYIVRPLFFGLLVTTFNCTVITNVTAINKVGDFTHSMVNNFNKLFEKSDKNFSTIVGEIEDTLNNFNKIFKQTRSQSISVFDQELEEITFFIQKEFTKVFIVLKRYQGSKGVDSASSLVDEIEKVFDLEKFFITLKAKLSQLHKNAIKEKDQKLVKSIEKFVIYLEKQKKEADGKTGNTVKDLMLLNALVQCMGRG